MPTSKKSRLKGLLDGVSYVMHTMGMTPKVTGAGPLSVTHPEISKQAFGWDPSTITAGSNKRMSWKCSQGHIWDAKIGSRTHFSLGCPYCSNNRVLSGFNDLATLFPDLSKEVDGWDPTTLGAGSNKTVSWKCDLGHTWKAKVIHRSAGSGCPYCSNHKAWPGFNDLATTHPELAMEAEGWDPTLVISGGNKKLDWKCSKGHIYETSISERKVGNGCPYCSGKRVLKGFNDLESLLPELAKEAVGWDPSKVTIGTNKRLLWRCPKGHDYLATPSKRRSGRLCSFCSNQVILPGYNDLQTTHPHLAAEAFGWDPTEIFAGSDKKLIWKCSNGHQWKMRVADRKSGDGCVYCSGHQVLAGHNDLQTTHPELALQANGWDPTKVNAGSNKKLEWKCRLGHTWKAIVANRTIRNDSCVYCSNKQVLPGFNDLATTHPELSEDAVGWDPRKFTAGSGKKLKWKCPEGHTWSAVVGSRTNLGSGCPSCAKSGFDPNKDGYLYFLEHEVWDLFQIGITNYPDDRLSGHRRLGWVVLEVRGPLDGHITQTWETEMLRALKRHGAVIGPKEIAGKFDGFSETWTRESLKVKGLRELMQIVEKDEDEGKIKNRN